MRTAFPTLVTSMCAYTLKAGNTLRTPSHLGVPTAVGRMYESGLFSELPSRVLLRNPHSYTRIGIRDRGRLGDYHEVLRVEAQTPCNGVG